MTHLRIEQGGTTEYVTSTLIHKLYEYAKEIKDYEADPNNNFSGDSLVSLKGTLSAPIGYRVLKEWLESTFSPDLHITLDNYAIPFEDPNMVTYLNSIGVGSDGVVSEALAAAATVVANSPNTTVTKFNELRYFTNITLSKGGLSGGNSGVISFLNWTALLEVDISNFTSLGHNHGSSYNDTFVNCTALTTVTASDKLVDIGHNAFSGCRNLTTISGLDGTITLHSSDCFYNCSSLTSNNFSNVLFKFGPTIGNDVFRGCSSLTSITLDPSVTTIPATCFSECTNLSTIDLSNIVTIRNDVSGWGVFRNCKALTSIDLSSCTSIGSRAFDGCSKLTTVIGPAGGTIGLGAFYGCTKLTTIDLSNVTSISSNDSNNGAFRNCTSLTSIDLSNCTSIGNGTFRGCSSLLSVTNLSNCVTIGKAAFSGCSNLTTIDLSNCTSIGDQSFIDCTNLQSIIGLNSITVIPNFTFKNDTNLLNIGIDFSNVTDIQVHAFYNCKNLNKTIDLSNVTQLEQSAFYQCNKITVSNFPRINTYPANTFCGIGNVSILIPKEVTTISDSCFFECTSLLTLSFEQNSQLTTIGHTAFMKCRSLLSIVLPEGVTSIGQQAFDSCNSALIVDIPSTVTNIGSGAFNNIGYLNNSYSNNTTVIFRGNTPPTCPGTSFNLFGRANALLLTTLYIYVPDGAVATYKSQTYLSYYADRIFGISQMPQS